MNLTFDLKRPDPLFFAWKKAANTLYQLESDIYREIEERYGCQTLEVRRKDEKWIFSVLIKFKSEQHLTHFILKWGN